MSLETGVLGEGTRVSTVADFLRDFGSGLHDISQPLTTLQCRLYLGDMEEDPAAIRNVIAECLVECEEVISCMNRLQARLGELRAETGGQG